MVNDQPKGFKVVFERRLRYLETQKVWERPYESKRRGTQDIWEIILTWNKVQYRPLGFFKNTKNEFILLIGTKEKDWKIEPRSADKIAEGRKNLALKDEKYVIEYFK